MILEGTVNPAIKTPSILVEPEVKEFPFTSRTGLMTSTSSATSPGASYIVNACPGDLMHFTSCEESTYVVGDGYLRLYDLSMDSLVAMNGNIAYLLLFCGNTHLLVCNFFQNIISR